MTTDSTLHPNCKKSKNGAFYKNTKWITQLGGSLGGGQTKG
jgi:hypothetical protein